MRFIASNYTNLWLVLYNTELYVINIDRNALWMIQNVHKAKLEMFQIRVQAICISETHRQRYLLIIYYFKRPKCEQKLQFRWLIVSVADNCPTNDFDGRTPSPQIHRDIPRVYENNQILFCTFTRYQTDDKA